MRLVKRLAVQAGEGLHRLVGRHVDRGPVGVGGAFFHQREVEAAKVLSYLPEAAEVARVAAAEGALVAALERPQSP